MSVPNDYPDKCQECGSKDFDWVGEPLGSSLICQGCGWVAHHRVSFDFTSSKAANCDFGRYVPSKQCGTPAQRRARCQAEACSKFKQVYSSVFRKNISSETSAAVIVETLKDYDGLYTEAENLFLAVLPQFPRLNQFSLAGISIVHMSRIRGLDVSWDRVAGSLPLHLFTKSKLCKLYHKLYPTLCATTSTAVGSRHDSEQRTSCTNNEFDDEAAVVTSDSANREIRAQPLPTSAVLAAESECSWLGSVSVRKGSAPYQEKMVTRSPADSADIPVIISSILKTPTFVRTFSSAIRQKFYDQAVKLYHVTERVSHISMGRKKQVLAAAYVFFTIVAHYNANSQNRIYRRADNVALDLLCQAYQFTRQEIIARASSVRLSLFHLAKHTVAFADQLTQPRDIDDHLNFLFTCLDALESLYVTLTSTTSPDCCPSIPEDSTKVDNVSCDIHIDTSGESIYPVDDNSLQANGQRKRLSGRSLEPEIPHMKRQRLLGQTTSLQLNESSQDVTEPICIRRILPLFSSSILRHQVFAALSSERSSAFLGPKYQLPKEVKQMIRSIHRLLELGFLPEAIVAFFTQCQGYHPHQAVHSQLKLCSNSVEKAITDLDKFATSMSEEELLEYIRTPKQVQSLQPFYRGDGLKFSSSACTSSSPSGQCSSPSSRRRNEHLFPWYSDRINMDKLVYPLNWHENRVEDGGSNGGEEKASS